MQDLGLLDPAKRRLTGQDVLVRFFQMPRKTIQACFLICAATAQSVISLGESVIPMLLWLSILGVIC